VKRGLLTLVAWSATLGVSACSPRDAAGQPAPLVLERTIPLAGVEGRIDHLALDGANGRLFVAALGGGAVVAVDLAQGRVGGRITGLTEPQGLRVLADRGELVVASGGGEVGVYGVEDLARRAQLKLGEDADNVRVDPASGRVLVGYGDGALAVLDPAGRTVVRRIALPAHPEAFQIAGSRVFVNLPGARRVGVVDLAAGALVGGWPNGAWQMNYPLAIDPASGDVAVVYRLPARLVVRDAAGGAVKQDLATCGDADDLSFDARRGRLYVACGDGHVDVLARGPGGLAPLARIATSDGARTALFDPDLDRLFVAARARAGRPAAILVLRPQ
jgi:sugar lactone lactonase YvrE